MDPVSTPLTISSALTAWSPNVGAAALILAVGAGYCWCARRAGTTVVSAGRLRHFGVGVALWILATTSAIATYSTVLFWVRALQVLLLLFVVPFFLAMGTPVSVLRAGLVPAGRERVDRALASRPARFFCHPLTTSVAMLSTPWLLYLTPWYPATLVNRPVAAATEVVLVMVGFGYFYARLQADPVPRRYSQVVSLIISIAETLGDGLLGIVLWLGPLIAVAHYSGLNRRWGPSLRVDQSIGAGILWILGDVLGVAFLLILMRALSADETARTAQVDAELDRAARSEDGHTPAQTDAPTTLWWHDDPQLRDRFGRR